MPRKTAQDSSGVAMLASKTPKTTTKKTTATEKTTVRKTPSRRSSSRRPAKTSEQPPIEVPSVQEPRAEATLPLVNGLNSPNGQWRRMDLHMHTPASRDYEQPEIRYLDILRQAERRGLDIIAFTDHNTVNGYRNMQREIAELELLEKMGRIRADEMGQLHEYRRLLKKVLVLPGFEFTATFGFHVIGLFPPDKSLRDMEFILMQLRVPTRVLEQGLTEAGATSDVLTAYRMIDEAGGIVIAPHANSSNGVFMRGMNIGGQTRMAYTQDAHLYAIELTDLAKGRRSMAMWFNGHKPEYSRRMHIIQGSDAHRLTASPTEAKRLGMGDRATEVFLPEMSFNALRDLFLSQEFERERPAPDILDVPSDLLRTAREKGNNETQSFHPALPKRGDRFEPILSDVAAFANASGGTIYLGCDTEPMKPAVGLKDTAEVSAELAEAIQQRISPSLKVAIDLQTSDEVDVLRITVPRGTNLPYVIDSNRFFVRDSNHTHAASRDEIIDLVRKVVEVEPGPAVKPSQEPRPAQQHVQPQRHQQPSQRQPQQQPAQQSQSSQQQASQRQQQGGQQRSGQQQSQRDQGRRGQREQQPQQPSRREQHQAQQHAAAQQPQAQPPANGNKPVETAIEVAGLETTTPETAKTPQLPAPEVQVEGSPRSGVEILAMEEREGTRYYTVRDLRNRSTVRNVTQKSARDLWLYAIMQHTNDVYDVSTFDWHNDRAVLSRSQRAGKVRYDLALRDASGKVHIFFGVADDAIDNRWKELIQAIMPPEPAPAPETTLEASTPPTLAEGAPTSLPLAEPPVEPPTETFTEASEPALVDAAPVAELQPELQPESDNTFVPETYTQG